MVTDHREYAVHSEELESSGEALGWLGVKEEKQSR